MSRKEYNNKCFSPNWLEVDLAEVSDHQLNKEERLESKRRKDLNTLLKELDEIKQNIEKAEEKFKFGESVVMRCWLPEFCFKKCLRRNDGL